jgi:glutaconyl-CoA/methylmalonyl-CoA decarboxylase subunit delta
MLLGINFDFSSINGDAIIICVVGYVIVFTALLLLYFVFNNLPKLLKLKINLRNRNKVENGRIIKEVSVTGEVNAAISVALYMYFNELHDEESNVITIKKVSKAYSPWSSKIYGIRNFPKR